MKGTIKKINNNWVVKFPYTPDIFSSYLEIVDVELPILPEQQTLEFVVENEGKLVDFEYIKVQEDGYKLLPGFAKLLTKK